ncbi:MAG: tyrosine recombinase XerC [Cardiobacteriaceae bacterium]|nr:tyrosine recombinase XerC [Cardiobacteriaceae bacterium]
MNDIEDYIAYLRYERAKATQTLATYQRLLQQCAAAHAEQELRALNKKNLQRYLGQMMKAGYNPATLNQHRAALRGFYEWLHRQRGLAENPAASLKLPRKIKQPLPKALTPEQISTLLAAPDSDDPLVLRDHAILELFYSAGLRLAELAALDTDLRSEEQHIIIRGKGGVERLVFIGSKAREALERWRAVRGTLQKKVGEKALFLNKNGTRLTERGIALRLKAYAAEKLPGINVHPHMLRHSFASHILQSSGDIRAVQELLGHKQLATTQIYTHLDFQHLAKAYDQTHPRAKKKSHS